MDLDIMGGRPVGARQPQPIHVRAGRISGIELEPSNVRRLLADGLIVAPGFIDLQVNGAFGCDFTTDPGSAWNVGPQLATTGVTAFLPTMVSSAADVYDGALALASSPVPPGAVPLGWHFEGPFLSPARHGAHRQDLLRDPDASAAAGWSLAAGVRMVTLAPELPGALQLARRLTADGVVVAAGHTDADARDVPDAVDAGVRYATHLLNAMRGLDHRRPGIGLGLLLDAGVTVGLIADGHHLADEMLRLIWRLAGPERVSLVSDGMAALGRGPGSYALAGGTVSVGDDGSARLADGRLAGAIVPLDQAVRRLRDATGCDLDAAIGAVTTVPARLLGLADRGRLDVGSRADVVLLTEDGDVVATLVDGDVVHGQEAIRWD